MPKFRSFHHTEFPFNTQNGQLSFNLMKNVNPAQKSTIFNKLTTTLSKINPF